MGVAESVPTSRTVGYRVRYAPVSERRQEMPPEAHERECGVMFGETAAFRSDLLSGWDDGVGRLRQESVGCSLTA